MKVTLGLIASAKLFPLHGRPSNFGDSYTETVPCSIHRHSSPSLKGDVEAPRTMHRYLRYSDGSKLRCVHFGPRQVDKNLFLMRARLA